MTNTIRTNEPVSGALSLAHRDFRIFPLHGIDAGRCDCGSSSCQNPGKHPHIKAWVQNATTDAKAIQDWWTRWPNANIAVATGAESGVFVLDIDGEPGAATMQQLMAEHNWQPATLTAVTGKGKHFYFKHPGFKVRNKVRVSPGIDVRGDAGYVVAPPSIHASGVEYKWENTGAEIVSAPDWLLALLTKSSATAESFQPATSAAADGEVEVIHEGQRNNELTRIAGLLHASGKEQDEIEAHLLSINEHNCNPPLPVEEVKKIAASIFRYPRNGTLGGAFIRNKEENPLYYFQFNAQRYLADEDVRTMEDYQRGWLTMLEAACWLNGATLENDPKKLFKLSGASSQKKFEREKDVVLKFFDEDEVDGKPILVHRQRRKEWVESCAAYYQKVEAGRKSGEMRSKRRAARSQEAESVPYVQ